MNDYDTFEANMVAAGWSLEEIEAAWQSHLADLDAEAAIEQGEREYALSLLHDQ